MRRYLGGGGGAGGHERGRHEPGAWLCLRHQRADAQIPREQYRKIGKQAAIRKDEDYKASKQGEILYTGQFGDICGIPCVCSKLVPEGTVYITTKDAVKFFVKAEGSVEQDRDIETKQNTVVYERHGLMALVDETKSIKLTKTA
jgi:hypothetical protein